MGYNKTSLVILVNFCSNSLMVCEMCLLKKLKHDIIEILLFIRYIYLMIPFILVNKVRRWIKKL